ncbi:alpha-hydroxy-acid oxidizing protein [Aquibacillus koreensis]|uniref:Alpha-hydroxy-acid oxidizing protein n=1 Tax=Aquibacillus koreensis TaxID=279446 RepID=A0A9X3WIR0_9BACI|nr:alpha-hydroxy-acid oxidizing protein [Aquibacillus koreensis]MCT2536057.1 alpha-hydroxy-acid oxidizing protein [Aquibacillus koreensis]MDC3420512.1 alpha-hydroxy-acid oxidizing protein [Aquibacillus koreensis]
MVQRNNHTEVSIEEQFNKYIAHVFGTNDALYNQSLTNPLERKNNRDVDIHKILHGKTITGPLLLAPAPSLCLVHEDGELAVAKAATDKGVPFIASTFSSYTLEEIADVNEGGVRWFQLDYPNDSNIAKSFAQRAELAGYQAIVISLDASPLAGNESILTNGYANFAVDPFFIRRVYGKSRAESYFEELEEVAFKPSVTWADLAYIRDSVTIPIYLKGNFSEEKVKLAVENGVDGIILTTPNPSNDLLKVLNDLLGNDRTLIIDNSAVDSLGSAFGLGINLFVVSLSYIYGLVKEGKAGVEFAIESQLDNIKQSF